MRKKTNIEQIKQTQTYQQTKNETTQTKTNRSKNGKQAQT